MLKDSITNILQNILYILYYILYIILFLILYYILYCKRDLVTCRILPTVPVNVQPSFRCHNVLATPFQGHSLFVHCEHVLL